MDGAFDVLFRNIERSTNPEELLKEIIKWEGVSSHAQLFAFGAMQRLRDLGWKIPKYARDIQNEGRRLMVKELLSREYSRVSEKTLNVYVSNFNKFLRMDDEEFKKLERITITHSRGRHGGLMALSEVEIPVSVSAVAQLGERRIEVEKEEEEEGQDESEEGIDDDVDAIEDDANEDGLASDGVAGEAADEADGSVAPRRSSRVRAGLAGQQESVSESDSGSVDAKVHSRRPARRAVQDNFVVERPSKRIALDSSMMLNDLLHTTQWVRRMHTHMQDRANQCMMLVQALATLEALDRDPREFSPKEQEHSFGLLRGRAEVLDNLYMKGERFMVLLVCVCVV